LVIGNRRKDMKDVINTFEDLKCWQACRELRRFVMKRVVPTLPPDEKYRLADQLIRAARSTTANIAEGYGRFHYMDNAKFCSNSRGSCWEVLDHLITACDDEMIPERLLADARELIANAAKLTNGYMNYLKSASAKVSKRSREPNED
jgi:four helix bundle protein